MQKIRLLFLFIVFYSSSLIAQLNENFSDGDFLINPTWKGELQDFIVNTDYQLQLDAPDGGESNLYTEFEKIDSIEWGFYFKMDFNPSNSNKLRVYLMLDKIDISNANGYYIEIGENGSEDKINFYKISNGISSLLGEGTIGAFNSEPASAYLKIIKDSFGIWQFFIKKDNEYYQKELELFENEFNYNNPIFLINCKYTTTRKDKFFFDDFYIKSFSPDIEPPKLLKATLVNKKDIHLFFDEVLSSENIQTPTNYSIVSSTILPIEINYNQITPNKIILKYEEVFESGKNYEISVLGLKDLSGNKMKTNNNASFFLIESPSIGDLIINEILFNPNTGGKDFIELYNVSNKYLNLNSLSISNRSKENNQIILVKDVLLKGGEYICIADDTIDIINNYFVPDSAKFLNNKIPSFDDKNGNVTLSILDTSNSLFITIDSFNYNEDMHSDFISSNEGISLERKNPMLSSSDNFNWNSASTLVGGATPGYKNSSFFELEKNDELGFKLLKKVFSPNFDGIDDELKIQYKFENSNNLTNIHILDAKGRLITQLINNETLGKQGLISWGGHIDNQIAPIGIYLLYYQVIDENGNSINGKKAFVLADYLK